MPRKLLLLVLLLVVARVATIAAYSQTLYYYGMIASQFGIAEAAYRGHWFAHDATLSGAALEMAKRQGRYVPIEEWRVLPRSGAYTTFPATDLPGYGYLIALTSRWLDDRLTTRWAMGVQVVIEAASVLLLLAAVASVFGHGTARLAGLLYVFAYPFNWAIASLPMRDIFAMGGFATAVVATLDFVRAATPYAWLRGAFLLILGSLTFWARPYGYYAFVVLVPLVLMARARPLRQRAAFAALLVVVPWLAFGLPMRWFNTTHYGVADTDLPGRALWEHLGIVKDNPYGFVLDDAALLPWIRAHHGRDVEYGSPEMNRLLGDYARRVVRDDPAFMLEAMALSSLAMLKTPLDFVPPFPLVEYSTSGMTLAAYARAYPQAAAFKAFNRVFLTSFFYGGLFLLLRRSIRRPQERLQLAVLMSPILYTVMAQAVTHFEARYMAGAAWVLVVPWASALEERLAVRTRAGGEPNLAA